MHMKIFPIALVSMMLCYACGGADGSATSPVEGCYADTRSADRVEANFRVEDNSVTGTLAYNFAEKDANTGTFTGMLHGDTLRGVYTFQSEGQTSKREVAFLRKGETLTEGYGDSTPTGDVQRFTNVAKISYGQGFVLTKTPCK